MVLAKWTAQVAPKAAHGQYPTTGVEPSQQLFPNGIQGQTGHLSVVQMDDSPGPAKAGLSLGQITVVKAQLADHVCCTTSRATLHKDNNIITVLSMAKMMYIANLQRKL